MRSFKDVARIAGGESAEEIEAEARRKRNSALVMKRLLALEPLLTQFCDDMRELHYVCTVEKLDLTYGAHHYLLLLVPQEHESEAPAFLRESVHQAVSTAAAEDNLYLVRCRDLGFHRNGFIMHVSEDDGGFFPDPLEVPGPGVLITFRRGLCCEVVDIELGEDGDGYWDNTFTWNYRYGFGVGEVVPWPIEPERWSGKLELLTEAAFRKLLEDFVERAVRQVKQDGYCSWELQLPYGHVPKIEPAAPSLTSLLRRLFGREGQR